MTNTPIPARYDVRVIKNVLIPMRDGVRLAADLFLPAASGRFPAVLEYIPYRKDDNTAPGHAKHHYYAQRGFAGVRVDIRGSGASEGVAEDEYSLAEQHDALEVLDWISNQSWCSGSIAMTGISYGGFTAIQTAMLQPPNLKAIVPIYATDNRYTEDCHYNGGLLRAHNQWGRYGLSMVPMLAMPAYPEISGSNWMRIWMEHLDHLAASGPWLWRWLEEQTDGPYWRHGSLDADYGLIQCPTFLIGGWRDGYPNWPLRTFANLHVPKKVIVGPYTHLLPDTGFPGPNFDYLNETVRWFAQWLNDDETGILDEPPVTIYMMEYQQPSAAPTTVAGSWRHEEAFPIPDLERQTFYLYNEHRLTADSRQPKSNEYDEYVYDPTVGTTRGMWCWFLPTDQRPDEAYGPTYSTAPLSEPLAVLGNPTVELYVSSTAPIAAFVAVLADVAPDGTSAMVCKGALNATRRHSLSVPEPLTPGEIVRLTFDLDATGWVFHPGHRIQLAVCSADWPNLWPTPFPAVNRVYHTDAQPSALRLPVVPLRSPLPDPPFHPPPDMPETAAVSKTSLEWRVEEDRLDGTCRVSTRAAGVTKPAGFEIALASERTAIATAARDAPEHVIVTGHIVTTITRPEGQTRLDTRGRVRSDQTHFHGQISLEITNDEQPFWSHTWTRSFERILL